MPKSQLPLASGNNPPPGSFFTYKDMNDHMLQFALDHVASLHPNIVNYEVAKAEYQMVAGINIKLVYSGLDKYS